MRLATLRRDGATLAVRLDADTAIVIEGAADVGALLADPEWRSRAEGADGERIPLADLSPEHWAPVVPHPAKVVCVGLNYRNHILEMGRSLPEYPTLFAKYPDSLIGAYDDIAVPGYAGQALDWEGELAVVIGAPARRLNEQEAGAAIAGYAVLNDITMRDYQYRSPEWFQGKTLENSTPFGPYLVTADEFALGGELRTEVDGETVQSTPTDDLVFSPPALVAYISAITPLRPGDVIASGTPGGVGHARDPKRYLADGSRLVTSIDGLGELRNTVRIEQA